MAKTKSVGDATETRILHELVSAGYSVLIPFGDNDPYDLVVDDGDEMVRVQCKTGWIEGECIRFKTASKTTRGGEVTLAGYGGEVDAFAVRCKDDDSLYWVPIEDASERNTYLRIEDASERNTYLRIEDASERNTYLRIEDARIDHPSINWASEFEFAGRVG